MDSLWTKEQDVSLVSEAVEMLIDKRNEIWVEESTMLLT
jgi:hypothetical protein